MRSPCFSTAFAVVTTSITIGCKSYEPPAFVDAAIDAAAETDGSVVSDTPDALVLDVPDGRTPDVDGDESCTSTWTTASCAGKCGRLNDNCGTSQDCGDPCVAPQTCSALKANECGCKAKTCADLGKTCGDASDGCGGSLTCGTCAAACTPTGCAGAVEVAVAIKHVCARLADGSAWCWGDNIYGKLGDGTVETRTVPSKVPIPAAVAITVGDNHSCTLLADRTVQCWGINEHGELGDGTNAPRLNPVTVSGLTGVDQIIAGAQHTCARIGGSVKCWGRGIQGQIGDGSSLERNTPTAVSGVTDAVGMAVGSYHACVLRSSKRVSCWGENNDGQLGDGSTTRSLSPVDAGGGYSLIFSGGNRTCALLPSGGTCWGAGQKTPTAESAIAGARSLALAYDSRCMIDASGIPYCWGSNTFGQLGDGTKVEKLSPTRLVDVASASSISTFALSFGAWTCAVSNGAVYCWGKTPFGVDATTPQKINW
jgi:hypothetical protein